MQRFMQTFPQDDQETETGRIPVENSHFSTFSTAFSTGVFHRWEKTGYTETVDINSFDKIGSVSNFFDSRNFYHTGFLCAKIPP